MNKKSIAVLLTCHNRRDKTIICLNALFNQKDFGQKYDFKVFLVDDGSDDGTSDAVAQEFPQVKLLQGDGNLFWNRGMHLAWSEAAKEDFDFYLWLNDDTMLFPTALQDILNCSRLTDEKSIICGTTRSAINGTITYGGRSKTKGLLEPNNQLQQCDYFNGNCVLVPKSVYNAVGNLDYMFSHSTGDWDYGLRAAKKGIKSFISYYYVGTCEKHDSLPKWCSPSVKLSDRIKAFQTPLAVNPVQHFKFDLRHNGLLLAAKHYLGIYLRLFFPSFWNKKA